MNNRVGLLVAIIAGLVVVGFFTVFSDTNLHPIKSKSRQQRRLPHQLARPFAQTRPPLSTAVPKLRSTELLGPVHNDTKTLLTATRPTPQPTERSASDLVVTGISLTKEQPKRECRMYGSTNSSHTVPTGCVVVRADVSNPYKGNGDFGDVLAAFTAAVNLASATGRAVHPGYLAGTIDVGGTMGRVLGDRGAPALCQPESVYPLGGGRSPSLPTAGWAPVFEAPDAGGRGYAGLHAAREGLLGQAPYVQVRLRTGTSLPERYSGRDVAAAAGGHLHVCDVLRKVVFSEALVRSVQRVEKLLAAKQFGVIHLILPRIRGAARKLLIAMRRSQRINVVASLADQVNALRRKQGKEPIRDWVVVETDRLFDVDVNLQRSAGAAYGGYRFHTVESNGVMTYATTTATLLRLSGKAEAVIIPLRKEVQSVVSAYSSSVVFGYELPRRSVKVNTLLDIVPMTSATNICTLQKKGNKDSVNSGTNFVVSVAPLRNTNAFAVIIALTAQLVVAVEGRFERVVLPDELSRLGWDVGMLTRTLEANNIRVSATTPSGNVFDLPVNAVDPTSSVPKGGPKQGGTYNAVVTHLPPNDLEKAIRTVLLSWMPSAHVARGNGGVPAAMRGRSAVTRAVVGPLRWVLSAMPRSNATLSVSGAGGGLDGATAFGWLPSAEYRRAVEGRGATGQGCVANGGYERMVEGLVRRVGAGRTVDGFVRRAWGSHVGYMGARHGGIARAVVVVDASGLSEGEREREAAAVREEVAVHGVGAEVRVVESGGGGDSGEGYMRSYDGVRASLSATVHVVYFAEGCDVVADMHRLAALAWYNDADELEASLRPIGDDDSPRIGPENVAERIVSNVGVRVYSPQAYLQARRGRGFVSRAAGSGVLRAMRPAEVPGLPAELERAVARCPERFALMFALGGGLNNQRLHALSAAVMGSYWGFTRVVSEENEAWLKLSNHHEQARRGPHRAGHRYMAPLDSVVLQWPQSQRFAYARGSLEDLWDVRALREGLARHGMTYERPVLPYVVCEVVLRNVSNVSAGLDVVPENCVEYAETHGLVVVVRPPAFLLLTPFEKRIHVPGYVDAARLLEPSPLLREYYLDHFVPRLPRPFIFAHVRAFDCAIVPTKSIVTTLIGLLEQLGGLRNVYVAGVTPGVREQLQRSGYSVVSKADFLEGTPVDDIPFEMMAMIDQYVGVTADHIVSMSTGSSFFETVRVLRMLDRGLEDPEHLATPVRCSDLPWR